MAKETTETYRVIGNSVGYTPAGGGDAVYAFRGELIELTANEAERLKLASEAQQYPLILAADDPRGEHNWWVDGPPVAAMDPKELRRQLREMFPEHPVREPSL
jgi:hypothetical protein